MCLYDMHCHLDFGEDPQALAADLERIGIRCLSATVVPSAFLPAKSVLSPYPNVRVGLGLHPWWVGSFPALGSAKDDVCAASCAEALGENTLAEFAELIDQTKFVAEVGLDFGSAHKQNAEAQLRAFKFVAKTCADACSKRAERKVISLHAVRSAAHIIEILSDSICEGNTHIFHWFSGSFDELNLAVDKGFYFSVNPRMLESKRGKSYAQAIPSERLLLETDKPASPSAPFDALAAEKELKYMISQLADLRSTSYEALEEEIAHTSATLL